MGHGLKWSVAAALVLGCTGIANAYTTYMGEDVNTAGDPNVLTSTPKSDAAAATFLAQFTSVGTVDFETAPQGNPPTISFPNSKGSLTASLTGGDGHWNNVYEFGRYSVPAGTSSGYWDVSASSDPSSTFEVKFSSKVAAFGFYGIDIGDFGGNLLLNLLDDDGKLIQTLRVGNTIDPFGQGATSGSVLYFGFLASDASEYFRTVQFVTDIPVADGFAFDNFSVGEAQNGNGGGDVPEPASLALVGAALLGAAASRRARGTRKV